eukprot:m.368861 g.368861  ORF g.368861 m.368861 type:complete len:66 (+) comp16671_c0_seq4:771-968(+)
MDIFTKFHQFWTTGSLCRLFCETTADDVTDPDISDDADFSLVSVPSQSLFKGHGDVNAQLKSQES